MRLKSNRLTDIAAGYQDLKPSLTELQTAGPFETAAGGGGRLSRLGSN